MSKLDPQWDAFPPMDSDTWWKLINNELKGSTTDRLDWAIDKQITGKPFYHTPDLDAGGPILRGAARQGWQIMDCIPPCAEAWKVNALGLEALEMGAQALVLPLSDPSDIPALLEGIILELAPVFWDLQAGADPLTCVEVLHFYLDHKGKVDAYQGGFIHAVPPEIQQEAQRCLPGWITKFGSLHAVNEPVSQLTHLLLQCYMQLQKVEKQSSIPPHGLVTLEIGNDYLLEIARLRAWHLLWGHLMSGFGWPPDSALSVLAIVKPDVTLPWENTFIAASTRGLSAILGGVDYLTIQPPDMENKAMGLRLARNVQHLMKEEAYLDKVIDPMAGSYAIEALTREIAEKAWADFNPVG